MAQLIPTALTLANTAYKIKEERRSRKFQRQIQEAQIRHRAKSAQLEKQQQARKETARLRARFAAAGIAASDGSAQAVLRRIRHERNHNFNQIEHHANLESALSAEKSRHRGRQQLQSQINLLGKNMGVIHDLAERRKK